MSAVIFNLALLTSLCVSAASTDAVLEVKSVLGADCRLQCTAVYTPGVQYRAVRWYKVGALSASSASSASPPLYGLLARELPNGTTRWYTGVEREVELLGESRDIFLPNVTCGDSGVYQCHLAAPVGEQNREGQVRLALPECPDEQTEATMTDAYLVILATAVLILALCTFLISYGSLKNILRDRTRTTKKETLLHAAFKPLEEKDLKSIYTLGPKASRTPKHVWV